MKTNNSPDATSAWIIPSADGAAAAPLLFATETMPQACSAISNRSSSQAVIADRGTDNTTSKRDRSAVAISDHTNSPVQKNSIGIPAVSEGEDTIITSSDDHFNRMEDNVEDKRTHNKRMRYSLSHPQHAAAAAAAVQRIVEHSTVQDSVVKQPIEWWKQPRKPPVARQTGDIPLCHVCQNPFQPSNDDEETKHPPYRLADNKTLLAYFAPANGAKSSHAVTHHTPRNDNHLLASSASTATTSARRFPQQQHHPQQRNSPRCCTFCERSDICSACLQNCEECQQPFCSFCRTTDDRMRHVCLECCAESRQQQANNKREDHHGNSMQID